VTYVFVIGTGRCGSTMVEEVLARHPGAGFLSNLEDRSRRVGAWTRPWNNRIYDLLPPAFTRKGRLRFAPSEGYRALDREVSPVLSRPWRDLTAADVTPWLAARMRSFFDVRAKAQGRKVFLHKFTGWPRAGFLGEVFPEAAFIHVVRDGRAVANSWLQMEWWEGFNGPDHWQWGPLPPPYEAEWRKSEYSFPILAGILWKLLIDAYDAAAARLPRDRWLEVRYEEVIESPGRAFAEMLDFAGLPADATFSRTLGRLPFGSDRAQAFRRDLSPETVAALSRSLEKHLEGRRYTV
jgi:sulfotransferase family protein